MWAALGSMNFVFDRLNEGRRDGLAVDVAANKIPERLFLTKQFAIRGVGINFCERFFFCVGA